MHERLSSFMAQWSHYLLQWKQELRASGVYVEDGVCTFVRGEFVAGQFRALRGETWIASTAAPHDTVASSLISEQAFVSVPRDLLAVRYIQLPSQDLDELREMVRHQLVNELPVSIDDVYWNCCIAKWHSDGSSTAYIQLVRKKRFHEFLTEITGEPNSNVLAVPESAVLTRRVLQHTESQDGAHCILLDHYVHVLMVRRGRAVFHSVVRFNPPHTPGTKPEVNWVDEIVQKCSDAFQKLDVESSTMHLHVWSTRTPEGIDRLEESLRNRCDIDLVIATRDPQPTSDEMGSSRKNMARYDLATAALEAGSRDADLVLNEASVEGQRQNQRTWSPLRLLLAVICVLAAISLFQIARLNRDEQRAGLLEQLVRQEESETRVIQQLKEDVVRLQRVNGDRLRPTSILLDVQKHAPATIRLEALGYARGERLSLRGRAPDVATVIQFSESLSQSELWQDVRIMGVHQSGSTTNRNFAFEIEANPRNQGSGS